MNRLPILIPDLIAVPALTGCGPEESTVIVGHSGLPEPTPAGLGRELHRQHSVLAALDITGSCGPHAAAAVDPSQATSLYQAHPVLGITPVQDTIVGFGGHGISEVIAREAALEEANPDGQQDSEGERTA